MKISASIYSDKKRSLQEVIKELEDNKVDLLHIDCNDDENVFNDISLIKKWTKLPLDLHIISKNPQKFFSYLIENQVDYLTIQYESLEKKIDFPIEIKAKKGLAISGNTPISVFSEYAEFDFILIMATTPGQSGGVFNTSNFKKIRDFKNKYPNKSIHVDGGVNAEVSFILRNMGVSTSVSGSYLFSTASVGNALMNLTNRNIESHFLIKDFMIPFNECPKIEKGKFLFIDILESIDKGNLGFTIVIDENNYFKGIISNADIRKGLIKNYKKNTNLDTINFINEKALVVNENQNVKELLNIIKKSNFPVMYLPVVNNDNKACGIVTFINLIKGES